MANSRFTATTAFLKEITSDAEFAGELINPLLRALTADGMCVDGCTDQEARFLEAAGKKDSPSSGAFIVDVILVLVCVLCAAGASGLTQVIEISQFNFTSLILFIYFTKGIIVTRFYGNGNKKS